MDKLYHVLCTYRITQRLSTRKTSFALAFGIEVVISIKLELFSARVKNFDEQSNLQDLRVNFDLLKEKRNKAQI